MELSKPSLPLRLFVCIATVLLPLKFGGFIGNGEQANFPLNGWEWLLFTCYPCYLAPLFGGVALFWAALRYKMPRLDKAAIIPGIWLLPILAGLAGCVNSTELDYGAQWLWHFAGAASLCVAVWWISASDDKMLPWLANTFAIAGMMSCFQGLRQHFWAFKEAREYAIADAAKRGVELSPQIIAKMEQTRIYGSFVDPNVYAAHLLCCLPFVLNGLWRLGKKFEKPMAGAIGLTAIGAVLNLLALFWAGSRGAALGAAAGILAAVWCLPVIRNWRWRWCLPLCALFLAIGLLLVVSLGSSRGGTATASVRLTYYNAALKMFVQHPVWGAGLGEFFPWYLRLKPLGAEVTRDPHNMPLSFLCQCGILGGLAALSIMLFPWIAATWWKADEKRGAVFIASCAGLAGWTVHSLFQFNEVVPGTLYLISLVGFFAINPESRECVEKGRLFRVLFAVLGVLTCFAVLRSPGEIMMQKAENYEREARGSGWNLLRDAAEKLPGAVLPWRMLNDGHISTGRWEEAVESGKELIKRTPHRTSSYVRMAKALIASNKLADAEEALKNAQLWYPWDPNVFAGMAILDYRKANVMDSIGVMGLMSEWLTLQTWIRMENDSVFVSTTAREGGILAGIFQNARLTAYDGKTVMFEANKK